MKAIMHSVGIFTVLTTGHAATIATNSGTLLIIGSWRLLANSERIFETKPINSWMSDTTAELVPRDLEAKA